MGFADRLARQAATKASQVASKADASSRADARNDDIVADVDLSGQAVSPDPHHEAPNRTWEAGGAGDPAN